MTRTVFRRDFGTLGQAKRTPQGGLCVTADLTRTGVFTYHDDQGNTIREYRPPEEVFRPETVATLKGSPITVDHPPERVNPENFSQWSMGHVGDDVRQDGNKTAATVYVQDKKAIKAIEAGRREVSCGYHCDVDETPGVTPEGEAYDRVQRKILYNHVALVDHGRAGADVRLRLDSEGNSAPFATTGDMPMEKIEIIEGVEYPVGSDPHRAARLRADDASKQLNASVEKLKQDLADAVKSTAEQKGRADAATAELAKVVEGAKQAISPERIDAMVQARQEILAIAADKLGKEFKTDGLTNRQIKLAVLGKVFPGIEELRQDSEIESGYLKGLWAGMKAQKSEIVVAPVRNDAADKLRAAVTPIPGTDTKAPTARQVRVDFMEEQEQRSRRPLALSKQ